MPSDPQQAPPPVQPLLPSAPPPPPRRRRLLGLWVALGVILVVGVVIVGLLAYTRSLVPPVISAAQAARLTEQTTFGSRSVDWVRSEVNLGEPPELPGCQEWYVIVKAKTTASFVATNEPDLQVYVFDTSATAENMVAQWFICDFAGGSSKSRMDDTARTEGVLWVANSERAFLAYSNVVVIAPLDTDDLNASIVATKTLVNSLR